MSLGIQRNVSMKRKHCVCRRRFVAMPVLYFKVVLIRTVFYKEVIYRGF